MFLLSKPKSDVAKYKEGYAIVGLGWLLVALIGAFLTSITNSQ